MTRIVGCLVVLSASFVSLSQVSTPRGNIAGPQDSVRPSPVANTRQTVRIDIEQVSNPLRTLAKQLSEATSIPVAYEEPAWVNAAELMRAVDSPEVRKNSHPAVLATLSPQRRVPALGSVRIEATSRPGQSDVAFVGEALGEAINDHGRRQNPGVFKAVTVADWGYAIVPANIRDANGTWVSKSSPLDARISFPLAMRTLGATLELIAAAMSDASGEKVWADIAVPGLNNVYNTTVTTMSADREVARDVLARTLRSMSGYEDEPAMKMRWDLEHHVERGPKNPVYSLRFMPILKGTADGGMEIVTWPKADKP